MMVEGYVSSDWPQPSARIRDLIRLGAEIALRPPQKWMQELHDAALSGAAFRDIADDPTLREGIRRTNLTHVLHWAAANVEHPGRRVPVQMGEDDLEFARDLTRRGLDRRSLDSFRTGQNVAWRYCMEICFGLTDDPAELRELLRVTALSISTFLDDTINAIETRMDAERAELLTGTLAERRAALALIIEGAPVSRRRAEQQLGYAL